MGLFPSPLPVGMTEFDSWVDSIMSTYSLPTTDVDSIRFTLAAMIINLGQKESSKPKYSFVLAIRASCAKQIAGSVFHQIKTKQLEAQRAQQQAEATAKAPVASDEPQK